MVQFGPWVQSLQRTILQVMRTPDASVSEYRSRTGVPVHCVWAPYSGKKIYDARQKTSTLAARWPVRDLKIKVPKPRSIRIDDPGLSL